MNTIHTFFEGLGIDPWNYLCVNMATTGVKAPIGVIEIAGKFGSDEEYFQQFVAPDDVMVPSDLNYAYTRIARHAYDNETTDTSDFLGEFLAYVREKPVDIVLINNEWWLKRMSKDNVNRSLFPLFSSLGRFPIFPIVAYETARVAQDYTLFDNEHMESIYDVTKNINAMKRQSPKGISCDIDCGYANREGPDMDIYDMTVAQENVRKMVYIWENMLGNNQAQEQLTR